MGEQLRTVGAHRAALGGRLEAVQHFGVGEVFGHEAVQLRRAERLEKAGQAQAHHFGVVAADDRQQRVGLPSVRVVGVKQAGDGAVDDCDDLRHRHRLQMLRAGAFDALGKCLHLQRGQHRHRDVDAQAILLERQDLPLDVGRGQSRQVSGLDPDRVHGVADRMNSSTASEHPLACAPSARPSSRKPPSAGRPTSSVRMVLTELKLPRSQCARMPRSPAGTVRLVAGSIRRERIQCGPDLTDGTTALLSS
ncbi:hypothetical protein G6F23_013214 [Rhizopus arrhizus]|nr:hypothetical protein G6F23_013214 [Rhizopus arrhizus]